MHSLFISLSFICTRLLVSEHCAMLVHIHKYQFWRHNAVYSSWIEYCTQSKYVGICERKRYKLSQYLIIREVKYRSKSLIANERLKANLAMLVFNSRMKRIFSFSLRKQTKWAFIQPRLHLLTEEADKIIYLQADKQVTSN